MKKQGKGNGDKGIVEIGNNSSRVQGGSAGIRGTSKTKFQVRIADVWFTDPALNLNPPAPLLKKGVKKNKTYNYKSECLHRRGMFY